MSDKLRGVIFDLGGTLIDYCPGAAWQDMEYLGASGWYDYLTERGYKLPGVETVKAAVWTQIQSAWSALEQGPAQQEQYDALGLARQLHLAAARIGIDLDPADLDASVRSYIVPIQAQAAPIPYAAETLQALSARGLALGLISNTMWPGAYHEEDLARAGLLEFFAPRVRFFSADSGEWKPNAAIFHMALDALALEPAEAVYIGDSIVFDIQGAQRAGMRGVWVENDDFVTLKQMERTITPDGSIAQLQDLLSIVDAWT